MPLPWVPALPLLTERLMLRAHVPADLDDLAQFHSDPEVVRYIPWPARTLAETRDALAVKLPRYRVDAENEWLVLAIELRSRSQVIGEVLLKCVSPHEGELGFALHSAFQRRGYGFEAATAILSLAFVEFGLDRVTATLDARNVASAALLEKLGMTREFELHDQPFKGELVDELHYATTTARHHDSRITIDGHDTDGSNRSSPE